MHGFFSLILYKILGHLALAGSLALSLEPQPFLSLKHMCPHVHTCPQWSTGTQWEILPLKPI